MSCTQPDEQKGTMTYDMNWLRDLTDVQLSGYPLFFSNWPERLNQISVPGPPHEGVLWHYLSPEMNTSVHIRMYIWHINDAKQSPPENEIPYPGAVYLGVTLRNPHTLATVNVLNPRRQVSTFSGNPLPAGICLAKATLGNTLDSFSVTPVGPGTTRVIQQFQLNLQNGVGVVYDFSLDSDPYPYQFELRTVVSPTAANLPNLTGTPVPGNNGGGRGYWENNQISADIVHGMAPANPGEHWSITRSGGPDILFTAEASDDSVNARTNFGNYGVIYDPITIRLTNATEPPFTARARLAARDTGPGAPAPPYAGAVDRGVGVRGVPSIQYNRNTGSGEVVFL